MAPAKKKEDAYSKIFTIIILSILFNFSLKAQTFDFTSCTENSGTVTSTVDGVTLTATNTTSSVRQGNYGGAYGTSGSVIYSNTPPASMTLTFDVPLNVTSLFAFQPDVSTASGNWVFTPNVGVAVVANIANGSGVGSTVTLNFTGVTSIVITRQDAAQIQFGVDNVITTGVPPQITLATYNYNTNMLSVSGYRFEAKTGAANDVDVSTLTFTGEGGATYTLSSTADVEITNSTSFSVTLTGADIYNVESLLNKNGITSDGGTTYNLAAADDWMANVTAGDISDATNQITVSNYANPAITSATYDYGTNTLVVTGTNFVNKSGATNDVDISLLTFTGEGGATYTLTSVSDVEITSSTEFSCTLSGTDVTNVEALLNKDGTTSYVNGTTYNLAAADNWMTGSPSGNSIADLLGNVITVSNYALPSITSAAYDFGTNVMTVTGTNFVSNSSGADVDVSKFQIDDGNGNSSMTVYSTDVEITSATEFSFTISGDDLPRSEYLMNKNGTQCNDGTNYTFLANDDWMTAIPSTPNISDYPNTLTVSNYAVPVITSVAYNYNTNVLTFTGTDFINNPFVTNDVDVSLLTIKGEGASTYALSSTGDVEVLDGSTFSITLSGTDIPEVEALLNKDGTSSVDNTIYNLAAAEDWMISAPSANTIADATSGITVSNYAVPAITSATYNWSNGQLVLTGTNFVISSGANDDIDASTLKIGGAGANEYTLTNTSDVDIASATSATLILSTTDRLNVNGLLNKNGSTAGDLTPYNLAAAEDWMIGSPSGNNIADGTATISVSNVSAPTITSATFNYSTAQFVVTGTNLAALYGATNDIDVSTLTVTGEGGTTHTIASTSDVEVTSSTEFSVTLSGTDIYNVKALLNKNGTASVSTTTYNLAAAEDWMGAADANATIADLTSNGITVSNFANPAITSATYDVSTGQLVVTGTDFVNKSGAANDIDASMFTITGGTSGSTYTLTTTPDVELTSATQFTLTLSAADQLNVNGLLNKNGTQSAEATTYNLAAAEDWMTGSPSGNNIADLSGNSIDVSNVAVPTITSATYNQTTGVFIVTGTNMFKAVGADNDVDISELTITGEGGNYTISNALTDVEITSATEFSFTVTGTDKTQIDSKLDQIGTVSSGAVNYNIAAADNWLKAADISTDISDVAGNGITVFIPPTISSATYNAATGVFVVSGANIQEKAAASDIDASKLTIMGEGESTYTLTNTPDVERTSVTEFTLTLSVTDKNAVNQILNKNGTVSSDATNYNLAAVDDWCTNVTDGNTSDLLGNSITVSNVPVPAITSATYNASTGVLVVTGTGFVKEVGVNNDVDVSKFTLTGEGGATYCICNSSDVDITSGTSFTVTLAASDKAEINIKLNKNGISSTSGTTYNLAAAEDWMTGTDASLTIADLSGNGITVSNVAVPTITSASYNWSLGTLTATGIGFLMYSGVDNDIDASKFTFKGEGGGTYTLLGTADVDITSGTQFAITLDATDKAAVNVLLNKEGTQSNDNTVYNLAAAEDWAVGADPAVNVVDATTPITASNFNTPPTGNDETVFVAEDTRYTFEVSDFTFNDADNDNFAGIKITTVESAGDLEYNGTDVLLNQDCLDVTLLEFTPGLEESGAPYATFTFQVKDDRGAYSTTSYTMTISVAEQNDLPVITSSSGFSVFEGEIYVMSNVNLAATDSEDDDFTLSFTITRNPEHGSIVTEGSFTQNDLANGKISYVHDGSDVGVDTLSVVAVDNLGGESEEVTLVITIINVNDPPVVSALSSIIIQEDNSYTLNVSDWYANINDPDNPDSTLTIGVSAGLGLVMTQSSSTVYIITPEDNFFGTSQLVVTVSDSSESVQTDVQVNVIAVNDLPVLGSLPGSISLEHAGSTSFTVSASDVETADSLLSFSVSSSDEEVTTVYNDVDQSVIVTAVDGFSGLATLTVTVTDGDGGTDSGTIEVTVAADPTGLEKLDGIPQEYSLVQNYPNPFNPSTTIRFGLPEQSNISLKVYDILGREVALLVKATKNAGYYEYNWDAGIHSSGIYIYVFTASSQNNQFRQIKKMLLVK